MVASCKVPSCRRYKNLNADGYCDTHESSSHEAPKTCVCPTCELAVAEGSKFMCCSLCKSWTHLECQNDVSEPIHAALNAECQGIKWYCNTCVEVIEQFTSTKQNEASIPAVETATPAVEAVTPAVESERTVCPEYKKGICPHGISGKTLVKGNACQLYHPKLCRNFSKFGADPVYGCNNADCKFFHPALCETSVKFRKCLKVDCTSTHLKGTIRKSLPRKYGNKRNGKFLNNTNNNNANSYNKHYKGRTYKGIKKQFP